MEVACPSRADAGATQAEHHVLREKTGRRALPQAVRGAKDGGMTPPMGIFGVNR